MPKLHLQKWNCIDREMLKKKKSIFLLVGRILRSVKEFLGIRGKLAIFRVKNNVDGKELIFLLLKIPPCHDSFFPLELEGRHE